MYLVYESLYGDLQQECDSTNVIGVYKTKEEAMFIMKSMVDEDIEYNNYVLDEERNNIEDGYVRLFFNNQENWNCYYEIFVKKLEVE